MNKEFAHTFYEDQIKCLTKHFFTWLSSIYKPYISVTLCAGVGRQHKKKKKILSVNCMDIFFLCLYFSIYFITLALWSFLFSWFCMNVFLVSFCFSFIFVCLKERKKKNIELCVEKEIERICKELEEGKKVPKL